MLADNDSNTTVDTIREVLNVFSNYPEGTNLANALAGKLDTTAQAADSAKLGGVVASSYATQAWVSAQGYASSYSPSFSGLTLDDGALYTYGAEFYLPNSGGVFTLATEDFVTSRGYLTSITKSMVTTALGYTPPTSNTTYSAGTGLSLSGTSFSVSYGSTAGTACQGNDSRLSNSRPASDVYSWAKASTKPTYTWSEITSKPDTFYTLPTASSSTLGGVKIQSGDMKGTTNTNGIAAGLGHTHSNYLTSHQSLAGYATQDWVKAQGYKTTDTNTWRGVQDNLTSTATDQSLSANQGRILNNKFNSYVEKSSPSISGLYLTDSVIYTDSYEFYFPTGGGGIYTIATQDWASGAFLGKTAKASSATVADSANSVAWGNVSGKPSSFTPASHTHDYLPLSGGTMTGLVTLPYDKAQLQFRGGHNSYDAVVSYQTSGNEAMLFTTKNAVTSFMFVNGEDTINNITSSRWTSLTPGLQIKNNCVAISKLITNGTTPTYNLDVGGSANATTLYENGTSLSNKYQPKGSYLTGIDKTMVVNALGYTPPANDTNTWRGIQDNLTSSSTTDSLSANQGRVLNSNKLDKSGGTMTGPLVYSNVSGNNKTSNYISAGGGYSTGSGKEGLKVLAIEQSDATMGLGVDLTGGPYELTVATARVSNSQSSKIVFATHTTGTTAYKTLGTFSASGAESPVVTFNVNGTIQENGTALSSKYQAKGSYLTSSNTVKVNGDTQSSSTTIYAPTSAGSNQQILISNGGGAPQWFSLKTVNGNSLLGSGNVQISGGSGGGASLKWSGYSTAGNLASTIETHAMTQVNGRDPILILKIEDGGGMFGWAIGRYDGNYDAQTPFTGWVADIYGNKDEVYIGIGYGSLQSGDNPWVTEIYVIGG